VKRARWASIIITLAFLLSVIVPQASLAKQETTQVKVESGKGPQAYWIPTSDPKEAKKVIRQLEKGKSPEELGLIPASQHQLVKQTLEQKQKEVKNAKIKGTYPVDLPKTTEATTQAWNPPPFNYDDVTFEECVEHKNASKGWIKNRYAYCFSGTVVYSNPVGCGPSPFFCDWVAFRFTVIGHAYNGMRTVDFRYKIDRVDSDIDSISWRNGTKVSVGIMCEGTHPSLDCHGDHSWDTRTLAKWRNADSDGAKIFDSDPPPITVGNRDQVSYMDFWPRILVDPPGRKNHEIVMDLPIVVVRADSADYMYVFPNFYPKEGSVFLGTKDNRNAELERVVPTLYYEMTNPYYSVMKEAFQHHYDALMAPGSIIPGIRPRAPLTRLYRYYDMEQYRKNIDAKDQACSQLTRPGDDYQCDEFPFATTYEGAAQGAGKFSVRYIPTTANNTHGRLLGAWYAYERILHKDAFYINFIQ